MFLVCIVFVNLVKINQFLQTGNHNCDSSDDHGKRRERANNKAPHAIHVVNRYFLALSLDSTEQSVSFGLDVDYIIRVVHGSCTCA